MAIYRNIHLSFWEDSKIYDNFTAEDKYFYLWLLTNPKTNLIGCYEISIKKAKDELCYSDKKVKDLLKKLSTIHKIINYDPNTNEVLILNWHKYNWTKSNKLDKPILNGIKTIKNTIFKGYLVDLYNERDTVSIPYEYYTDTTVSVTVTDTVTDYDIVIKEKEEEKPKKERHLDAVLLYPEEYEKLILKYNKEIVDNKIEDLDNFMGSTGKRYISHYKTLLNWLKKDGDKQTNKPKEQKVSGFMELLMEEEDD